MPNPEQVYRTPGHGVQNTNVPRSRPIVPVAQSNPCDCNGVAILSIRSDLEDTVISFALEQQRLCCDPCFGLFSLQIGTIIIGIIEIIIGLVLFLLGIYLIVPSGNPFRAPDFEKGEMYLTSGIMGLLLTSTGFYHILLNLGLIFAAKSKNEDQCFSWIVQIIAEFFSFCAFLTLLGIMDSFGLKYGRNFEIIFHKWVRITPMTIMILLIIGLQCYFVVFVTFYVSQLKVQSLYAAGLTREGEKSAQQRWTSNPRPMSELANEYERIKVNGRAEGSKPQDIPVAYQTIRPKPMQDEINTGNATNSREGYPQYSTFATSSAAEEFRKQLRQY